MGQGPFFLPCTHSFDICTQGQFRHFIFFLFFFDRPFSCWPVQGLSSFFLFFLSSSCCLFHSFSIFRLLLILLAVIEWGRCDVDWAQHGLGTGSWVLVKTATAIQRRWGRDLLWWQRSEFAEELLKQGDGWAAWWHGGGKHGLGEAVKGGKRREGTAMVAVHGNFERQRPCLGDCGERVTEKD